MLAVASIHINLGFAFSGLALFPGLHDIPKNTSNSIADRLVASCSKNFSLFIFSIICLEPMTIIKNRSCYLWITTIPFPLFPFRFHSLVLEHLLEIGQEFVTLSHCFERDFRFLGESDQLADRFTNTPFHRM